jgi:hypothetical protein
VDCALITGRSTSYLITNEDVQATFDLFLKNPNKGGILILILLMPIDLFLLKRKRNHNSRSSMKRLNIFEIVTGKQLGRELYVGGPHNITH